MNQRDYEIIYTQEFDTSFSYTYKFLTDENDPDISSLFDIINLEYFREECPFFLNINNYSEMKTLIKSIIENKYSNLVLVKCKGFIMGYFHFTFFNRISKTDLESVKNSDYYSKYPTRYMDLRRLIKNIGDESDIFKINLRLGIMFIHSRCSFSKFTTGEKLII